MKTRTKYVANAVLVVILTAFTVWYLSKTQIITAQTITTIKWSHCLIVALWVYLCFAYISLIEKFVYSTFCRYPYKTALLVTVSGNLGSSVSPLKSAHFPLKAYIQKSRGLTLIQTLTGVTKCQIIFSATSVVVYLTLTVYLLFINKTLVIGDLKIPAFAVVGVGFITNFAILVILMILSRVDKLRITVLGVIACIIKIFLRGFNKAEFVQKKTERLALFKEQTSVVFSDFKLFIIPAVLYSIYMFMSCLSPYVSYLLVSGAHFSIKDCFDFYLLSLSMIYLTNVIPVPGGCVVAEFVFAFMFKMIIGNFLAQTLLVWRLSTYYIPTILNLIVFSVNSIKICKRN